MDKGSLSSAKRGKDSWLCCPPPACFFLYISNVVWQAKEYELLCSRPLRNRFFSYQGLNRIEKSVVIHFESSIIRQFEVPIPFGFLTYFSAYAHLDRFNVCGIKENDCS